MNRTVYILMFVFLCAIGINLWAQQKAAVKPAAKSEGSGGANKILYPNVYLGRSEFSGGAIKRDEFSRLLKQGLTSKDSLGGRYKVVAFDFNYAERQLYEDSAGNLKVMTDFMFEFCPGDTVTSIIASSIYDRVKPGDTVYVSKVRVVKFNAKTNKPLPDSTAIAAKGIKCIITK